MEVRHKAYSYTNKKGKRVTVAAHTEHPSGVRKAKPKKAAKKTAKKKKKQKTAIKTLK